MSVREEVCAFGLLLVATLSGLALLTSQRPANLTWPRHIHKGFALRDAAPIHCRPTRCLIKTRHLMFGHNFDKSILVQDHTEIGLQHKSKDEPFSKQSGAATS